MRALGAVRSGVPDTCGPARAPSSAGFPPEIDATERCRRDEAVGPWDTTRAGATPGRPAPRAPQGRVGREGRSRPRRVGVGVRPERLLA
jgi:hypothetical protein